MGGEYKMFRIEDCGFVAVVPCPRCRGEGWLFDDQECGRCSGVGELVFDVFWLRTLSHNLAIGAALVRAFKLGDEHGAWVENPYPDAKPWWPGCGRSAP